MNDTSATPDPLPAVGYAAAMTELDQILVELDAPELDIDQLADRVARAAQLVEICRNRIEHARMRVTEIVADLDEPTDQQDDETAEP
jgi:exodeoxyribonuclease VII small subunit